MRLYRRLTLQSRQLPVPRLCYALHTAHIAKRGGAARASTTTAGNRKEPQGSEAAALKSGFPSGMHEGDGVRGRTHGTQNRCTISLHFMPPHERWTELPNQDRSGGCLRTIGWH